MRPKEISTKLSGITYYTQFSKSRAPRSQVVAATAFAFEVPANFRNRTEAADDIADKRSGDFVGKLEQANAGERPGKRHAAPAVVRVNGTSV
jgi:hypothetical protein